MRIGNITIPNKVALGPMAGVSDLPFRLLCREFGCGLLYTEMVSAKALYYGSRNTISLLETKPEETPIAVQLFGSDPELLAQMAAQVAEGPYDLIDFNMGCPVPKIVNNREGSALMRDPKLAEQILTGMVRAVDKPVTVKIRKGFNDNEVNAVEIAKIAEASGVAAIAVHGRTREQYYSGEADWNIIREVKEAVTIPVIGNGDITSGASAKAMMKETGCDGIMVARAARGNPFIFREIVAAINGETPPDKPTYAEVAALILRHARMQTEFVGEYMGIRQMRKQVAWYTAGFPHSAELRRRVNAITSLAQLEEMLDK